MDKLFFGLSVTGLGLAIVFICLILIIGAIKIQEKVIGGLGKKAQPAPSAQAAPTPQPVEQAAPAEQWGIDPGVVAAIAAAIACMDQEQSGSLVVRSIRRVNNMPAWKRS